MRRISSTRVAAALPTVALTGSRGYFCRTHIRRGDVLGSGASGNILGTGSFPADFVRELHQDAVDADERRSSIAQPFSSSIRKSELDHMESPEADERHLNKLSRMTDDLFARIPTPEDPMAAALAPTKEEAKEREKFEILKEAVRDRYRAQQQRQQHEDGRIAAAMMAVEKGTYDRAKYGGTPVVDARKFGCDGVYEARPVERVETTAPAAKKGPSPPLTPEERRRLLNDEDDEDTIAAAIKGRGAFASLVLRLTGRENSSQAEPTSPANMARAEGGKRDPRTTTRRKTVEEEEQAAIEAMLASDDAPVSHSARSRAAVEAGGVAPIGAWTATEENTMTAEDAEKLKLLLELEATRRKMKALEDALKAKTK